ncbi:MAG: type II toxin-antitoxin system VapC family toxin [bacterium]|nr:type II toxin-antitoxin system VapC family toxin [bacterium]
MVLVDTSIWVEHLRVKNNELVSLLNKVEVATHPFIIGEIALGNLKNRKELLSLFKELPQVTVAEHEEVLEFTYNRKLMGQGIGWIDAHLLASALLTGTPLWTRDKKLRSLAVLFGILY